MNDKLTKEFLKDQAFIELVSNRIYQEDWEASIPEPEWIVQMTELADKYLTKCANVSKKLDRATKDSKIPMLKPKFTGKTRREGKDVEGHLFYFDDGRHYITPTGSDVYGFEGNEVDKLTAMFSIHEVWPESVELKLTC